MRVAVINRTDRAITGLSAESSCGCTVPEAPREIPAGGRADLLVRYDSRTVYGPVRQEVVLLQDGRPLPVALRVTGEVERRTASARPSVPAKGPGCSL